MMNLSVHKIGVSIVTIYFAINVRIIISHKLFYKDKYSE